MAVTCRVCERKTKREWCETIVGHGELIFSSPVHEWCFNESRFSCACSCRCAGESSVGCYDRIEWRELCFLGRQRRLYEFAEYRYAERKGTSCKIFTRCKRLCKK